MKTPPAFQFYASDYLSSSKVQCMSLEAEGAYIRLLAYSWQDGYIPADVVQLARMCKTNVRKMTLLWDQYLRDCFQPREDDPDKLVNGRLEQVRQEQIDHRQGQSEAGSRGAAKRWAGHSKPNGNPIVTPMAKNGSSSPSPSPSPTSSSEGKQAAPKTRLPDPAYEVFVEAFNKTFAPAKYQSKAGDFVRLAALRKAQQIYPQDLPPGWITACWNYVSSPLSAFSLADLSSRYAVFVHSSLDRYGKPVAVKNDAIHTFPGRNPTPEFLAQCEEDIKRMKEGQGRGI